MSARNVAIGIVPLFYACTPPKGAIDVPSTTFTYAPTLDKPYRQTMHRHEEVSVPGAPLRDVRDWTLTWAVVTGRESNRYKRTLELVGLKLDLNGVDRLLGHEIKGAAAALEVLTDKDGNVVEVHGTDALSAAIVALGAPEAQPLLRQLFSPEALKALAVVRTVEGHADFIGHPAAVGSRWTATDLSSGRSRQIDVEAEEPCGTKRCLRVSRRYEPDRRALFEEISGRVATYVASQGGDSSEVKLVGAGVKIEDSLLIDPTTMDYYAARFTQDAIIRVAGPKGELPVAFKVRRESSYEY